MTLLTSSFHLHTAVIASSPGVEFSRLNGEISITFLSHRYIIEIEYSNCN